MKFQFDPSSPSAIIRHDEQDEPNNYVMGCHDAFDRGWPAREAFLRVWYLRRL